MKHLGALLFTFVLCSSATQPENMTDSANTTKPSAKEISFTATDGGTVIADLYVKNSTDPVIILFHQGGSNGRAEYENIIPRLLDQSFNLLVVDQRSGGGAFYGGENRTIAARGGERAGFCEAYPDMVAALDFAEQNSDKPVIVWGSSYSAALSLKLAGDYAKKIDRVLAFSPAAGDAMGECSANQFISGVKVPTLGARPTSEMSKAGKGQEALFETAGLKFLIAEDGVHGSSMLDPTRSEGDTDAVWAEVLAFLEASKT